jgi:hypothetical protein
MNCFERRWAIEELGEADEEAAGRAGAPVKISVSWAERLWGRFGPRRQ